MDDSFLFWFSTQQQDKQKNDNQNKNDNDSRQTDNRSLMSNTCTDVLHQEICSQQIYLIFISPSKSSKI